MSQPSNNKENYNPYEYTNLYQGSRKYKNLRQQVKGEYKEFMQKITYIRIPLAIILVLILLLMTGVISDLFARRGKFETAKNLVIFPSWMETYKPGQMQYYNAGIEYENGDFVSAYNYFNKIDDYPKSENMKNLSLVMISKQNVELNDYDLAYDNLLMINKELLYDDSKETYNEVLDSLINHFQTINSVEANTKVNKLLELKEQS